MKITVKTTAAGLSDTKDFLVNPGNPLKMPALANSKVEIYIDGVKQTGNEWVNGKRVQLKKVNKDLVLTLDDEPLVDIEGFYEVQGASLEGAMWQTTSADGLTIQDGSMVATNVEGGDAAAAGLVGAGIGGLIALGAAGAVAIAASDNGNGGGDGGSAARAAALAKIEAYNNGDGTNTPTPTAQDYADAGVTGVSADNLAAVNAQVLKQNTGGADSTTELQALASAANAALAKIEAYNNGDGVTPPPLTEADYAAAGITGVTADNLTAVNAHVLAQATGGADTVSEIQALVVNGSTAMAKIEAYNNGDGVTPPPLTPADYAAAGVTGVTPDNLAAVNAQVLKQNPGDANSPGEVQTLVNAANAALAKIEAYNNGDGTTPPALTPTDYAEAGIVGVSSDNVAVINAKILALSPGGADQAPEVQTLVNAANTALAKIEAYNNGNGTTPAALTLADYAAAGITGVTAGNLAAVNAQVLSQAPGGANAITEVQPLVAAADAALAKIEAYNNGNGTSPAALTLADYAHAGITNVTADNLAAVNAKILALATGGADSAPEIQGVVAALNTALAKIEAFNNGNGMVPAPLTVADYAAAGVTDVTADNLAAVNAKVLMQATGAADTPTEIQAVVAGVNAAVDALELFAQTNASGLAMATGEVPTLASFANAGLTGVTDTNLSAVNDALASAAVDGSKADTAAKVQAIVNDYNAILASADGMAGNTATPLTQAQFTDIGVTQAPMGSGLSLLGSVIDGKASTAVDSVTEVQALADAAKAVMTGAAGGAAPTLAQLSLLGVTGLTPESLALAQAAIDATVDSGAGVDTLAKLQNVISGAVSSPTLTTTLGGVTNLDVTSNLVFSVDQSVTVGTGFIRITDVEAASGGTGYRSDVNVNHQTIDVATAVSQGLLTIMGTGANTKIIVNPMWDLDLSSNYQISIDAGAFNNASGTNATLAIGPISFSTVAPGTHTAGGLVVNEAAASQTMQNDGTLVASKSWMDIEGIGNIIGPMAQLGDLAGGAYALVAKNYATVPGGPAPAGDSTDGIAMHDTNVGVVNFGNNDVVYFDSQLNNASVHVFNVDHTLLADGGSPNVGGLVGQNTLTQALVNSPQQVGSLAFIALGLEGNLSNTVYGAVYDLPGTPGFANTWHNQTPPLVMG